MSAPRPKWLLSPKELQQEQELVKQRDPSVCEDSEKSHVCGEAIALAQLRKALVEMGKLIDEVVITRQAQADEGTPMGYRAGMVAGLKQFKMAFERITAEARK